MTEYQLLLLTYIIFIWLVVLHTFEEIGQGIIGVRIGFIHATRQKYLIGASLITTINLLTFALIFFNIPIGYYLGLFTSGIIGVFQAIVHGIGYMKERKPGGLGVGFFSSIPLALCGLFLLIQIIQKL